MTERERLIELIKKSGDKVGEYIIESAHMDFTPTTDEICGIRADHLLANGVIVPPVMVGQKVYVIHNTVERIELGLEDCVYETVVDAIHISGTIEYHMYYKKIVHPDCDFFTEKDLGKTVFLTKEEAEQALKGGAE